MKSSTAMKRNLEGIFLRIRKLRKLEGSTTADTATSHVSSIGLWEDEPVSSSATSEDSPKGQLSVVSSGEDSVSVVSSSELSVGSLEEGEIYAEGDDEVVEGDVNNGCLDDCFDLKAHIALNKRYIKQLMLLTKIVGTKDSFVTVCKIGIKTVKSCHQGMCLLAAVHRFLPRSNRTSAIRSITLCFKELYSVVTAFHASLLNVNGDLGLKLISLFAPYCIDMLVVTLPYVIACFNEPNTQKKFVTLFQTLVHSTLLKCCSICDHYEDETKMGAIESILHVLKTILPITLILENNVGDDLQSAKSEERKRSELFDSVFNDYILEEGFKPASLLLLQLQGISGISILDSAMSSIRNSGSSISTGTLDDLVKRVSYKIGSTAIFVGCAKRQFPTGFCHPSHYSLDEVSKVFTETKRRSNVSYVDGEGNGDDDGLLWHKTKYWLLLLLEDNNVHIRNIALRIIRHALITMPFIEKDRQHILSLVTDCVSDNANLKDVISVVASTSHLYPLKDGAVRRISNLTLKGCGTRSRLEVIRLFGLCHFTEKGAETAISIMQNLCEPMDIDETKDINASCSTSSITNGDTEILFLCREWPVLLKSLMRIKKIRHDIGLSNGFLDFVSRIRNTDIEWVRALWFCFNGINREMQFISALYRGEGAMRFPTIVSVRSTSSEIKRVIEAHKTFKTFMEFDKDDIKAESLKGNGLYLYIHHFREKGITDTAHKYLCGYQSDADLGVNADVGKKCHCIDCALDKMILSSKHKRSVKNINDDLECLTHTKLQNVEYEGSFSKRKGILSKVYCMFSSQATFGYYKGLSKFVGKSHDNIDDINCLEFQNQLGGVAYSSGIILPSSQQYIMINVDKPSSINMNCGEERMLFGDKHNYTKVNNGTMGFHMTHRTPTLYPIPLDIVRSAVTEKEMKEVSMGPQIFWVHSKRPKR
ncbi:DNA-binding helix-turn-helix, putative [Babesia ovis]|uniref:DNA-binding helix-turn-helix, putative n=1 Tax=Babesia ovis TaxID=5869 RepID=A0A9W5TBI7_BABOV|nr:DNA-binding helix-turn-helix, putative [Babesia ovis]